jgi:hypothetical protein
VAPTRGRHQEHPKAGKAGRRIPSSSFAKSLQKDTDFLTVTDILDPKTDQIKVFKEIARENETVEEKRFKFRI